MIFVKIERLDTPVSAGKILPKPVVGLEKDMWQRAVKLVLTFVLSAHCQSVALAQESVVHQPAHWELGVLGQVNNHLSGGVGLYYLRSLKEGVELHTGVWTSVPHPGGGVAVGTMHRVTSRFWLGWEASAECETQKEKVWFLGVGPVAEVPLVPHHLNVFLVAPLGWEHSGRNQFGWLVITGVTVAVWH